MSFSDNCWGNFMFNHQGFWRGYIDKGVMSDGNDCACTCRENIHCIGFSFRDDQQRCYVYEGHFKEKVEDANSKAYFNSGNDYS